MGHALLKLFAVAWPLLLFRPAAAQVPAPLGDAETRTRLDEYMAERASAGFSGVVIVARDGKVLLQRGYGYLDAGKTRPVAADSVFTTGSITKQFTAAAILKLEMQGRLKTNEAMARYLPGVPDDKRAITIHQLLTHTAGFPPASGDDLEAIGRDAFERLVLSRPLAQAPGTYEYSNVGYSLLAALVTELVMTMMFLIVILGATDPRAPKGFAPIAIGLGLTLIHLISIPVTNTSVNPARSTGVAVFAGGWALGQLWLFWIAPILGAALGSAAYRAIADET